MFIKLTGVAVTEPVFVKPDQIQAMGIGTSPETGDKFTGLHVLGVENYIPVQETPEQIMEMIEKCLSN